MLFTQKTFNVNFPLHHSAADRSSWPWRLYKLNGRGKVEMNKIGSWFNLHKRNAEFEIKRIRGNVREKEKVLCVHTLSSFFTISFLRFRKNIQIYKKKDNFQRTRNTFAFLCSFIHPTLILSDTMKRRHQTCSMENFLTSTKNMENWKLLNFFRTLFVFAAMSSRHGTLFNSGNSKRQFFTLIVFLLPSENSSENSLFIKDRKIAWF